MRWRLLATKQKETFAHPRTRFAPPSFYSTQLLEFLSTQLISNRSPVVLVTKCDQELHFLLTRPQWVISFLLNQCGSLVYYFLLGTAGFLRVPSMSHFLSPGLFIISCPCSQPRFCSPDVAAFPRDPRIHDNSLHANPFTASCIWSTEISMAVPICNSLTFMWTFFGEVALGGEKATLRAMCGAALVCLGVALCVKSKLDLSPP